MVPGARIAILLLTAGLPGLLPDQVHAQQQRSEEEVLPEYVFEVRSLVRWIHGGQQSRFTPHLPLTDWLFVDSLRSTGAGERTMFVSRRRYGPRGTGSIRFGMETGVQDVHFDVAPTASRPNRPARVQAQLERNRFIEGDGYLLLPEFSLYQFARTVRTGNIGESWTDTISIAERRDGFEQVVSGRRTSTIVGDTTIAGRLLHVIRDSAWVQYHERWLREERTLDTLVVTERDAAGIVISHYLFDPGLGLFRVREDTTRLSGTAVLHYPDGRSFRTPARFERTRRIDLYDVEGYVARRRALRAQEAAGSGGMVALPSTPIEERLAAGDTILRDSLLAELRMTSDADARRRLMGWLGRWSRVDENFDALLDRAAHTAADTARLIMQLQQSLYRGPGRQFDEATLQRALPFLADPGLVFRHDARSDPLYEAVRQALLLHPPVASDDTADWACTPAACRLLADHVDASGDPRLQALGLIAAFVMDPARYANQVVERTDAGETFLRPAAVLARGIARDETLRPTGVALPGQGAGWRDWLHWLSPTTSELPASLWSLGPFGSPFAYFATHYLAPLRVRERIDGRDIAQELMSRRSVETADSAILVFDALLLGMGKLQPQPDEVARLLLSDSEVARTRGRLALQHVFREPQPVAGDTAAEVIGRLLASHFQGAAWFPHLENREPSDRSRRGRRTERPDSTVFVARDGLPHAVIDQWRDRVQFMSNDEWRARPLRAAATLIRIGELRRVGPFIRFSVSQSSRHEREPHEAAAGWASGQTYTLMVTPSGWVMVEGGGWIT